jgi:ABC-type nickel/cobalt efflux system permease component RcnA
MQPDIALLSAIVICLALIVLVALVAGIALTLSVLGYMTRQLRDPEKDHDHRDH